MCVSGKITGLEPEVARALFASAAEELRLMGHTPMNPMELVPYKPEWAWEDYMLVDIEILFKCEGIYMLENWADSQGARIEHGIAKEMGIKVMYRQNELSKPTYAKCVTDVRAIYNEAFCERGAKQMFNVYATPGAKLPLGTGTTAYLAWRSAHETWVAGLPVLKSEPSVMTVTTGFSFKSDSL